MKHTHVRRGGFTLTEVVVGSALLFLFAAALTRALAGMRGMTSSGSTLSKLQEMGERALADITDDLRRSSFTNVGGRDYPYMFEDGQANGAFVQHAHGAAISAAVAGEPDFGPNREIVLVQPADADGNGVPDLDGNRNLVWGANDVSYTVVTRADGINYLERRDAAGTVRAVAHDVERVAFDDNVSSGFEVPLRAIRVRIFFRDRDDDGRLYRHTAEAIVGLRN